LPSIVSMPHVVQFDRINTIYLSFHAWPSGLNFPNLHHLILTNNLNRLKSFSSFPPTIRSIQLIFHARMPHSVCDDWSVLRSLSSLPKLTSFHIAFHDMNTNLDEDSCQIIAETASMLAHFGIRFRRRSNALAFEPDYDNPINIIEPEAWYMFNVDPNLIADGNGNLDHRFAQFLRSVIDGYQKSIEEIRRRILSLSSHVEPEIVVEEGKCGLTVWC
ncbi:unnamed protein product, partial [Adineta ricciae]